MNAEDAAAVQSEALRTAARAFVTEMGDTWGGNSQWLTTGTRVAEVVACVLREMADDLLARRCPTCVNVEGYDRLSGPCPDCQGTGVAPLTPPGSTAGGDLG